MKRWLPVLFAASLCSAGVCVAEDTIADQRHFHSSKSKHRVSFLRRGVETLFFPAKKAVNFAERVDLPRRIRDFFYNEDYTAAVFPAFSFGGELGGLAAGLNAFHQNLFHQKKIARAGFLYHDKDALKSNASYEDPAIGQSRWWWKLQTAYRRDDDVEIFSRGEHLGIFTRPEDKGSFSLTRFDGEIELARHISRWNTGLYGRGVRAHAEEGAGGGISLPWTLEGLGDVVHLGGGGAEVSWDRRDHPQRPTHGTLLSARGGMISSPDRAQSGGRYRYTEYRADLTHCFTLFTPRRILALHTALDRVDPLTDGAIPFYDLPILDKHHGARNFERGRFRDRGALALNAEYRYPIWVSWDAYLFLDAGQTFGRYRELRSNHLRYSEGFGIRFGSANKVFFNVVVGLGQEKPQIGVDFSQVF